MNLHQQYRQKKFCLANNFLIFLLFSFFLLSAATSQAAFVDNGNETITDTKTGLIWQKGSFNDIPRTWQEALEYSENLVLGGCNTWRLPNRKELRSLVDRSQSNPAIDPLFFSQSDKYWTSTPTRWFKRVWAVDFFKGQLRASDPYWDTHYIRVVTGGCNLDGTPPEVSSNTPAAGATNISINSLISVNFNEEIDPLTLIPANFQVKDENLNNVTGVISYSNGTMEFTPDSSFFYGETYTITLTTGITDIAGNSMAAEYQWSFTTELQPDNEPPTGSIIINSGAAKVNKTTVNLLLTASDNSGTVSSMRVRNNAGVWSNWNAFSQAMSWELLAGDGVKTIEAQFQDPSGNISGPYSDSIELDTVAPTISVNPPISPTGLYSQTLTGQTEVGTTILVSANTTAQISAINVTGSNWQCTVTGLATGSNIFTVLATDGAGNIASASTDIYFDNIGPVGTILLNNGAGMTNSAEISLQLAATDNNDQGVFFRLANSGTTWSDWQQLGAADIPWQLLSGDGTKTVLAQYQDSFGNITSVSDSITLDTVPPEVNVEPNHSESSQDNQVVSGTREANAIISLSVDTSASVNSIDYLSDTTWQSTVTGLLPGLNSVTVTAMDMAGNSAEASATIIYDITAPTGSLLINHDAAFTADVNVHLVFAPDDNNGQVTELRVRNAGDAWPDWMPFASSMNWTLSSGDEEKTIELQFRDFSGNISAIINDSIILDSTAPEITIDPFPSPINYKNITLSGTREADATVSVATSRAWVGPIDYTDPTGWQCSLVLEEGETPITVTASDSAGNSSSASITLSVDSLALLTLDPVDSPTRFDNQEIFGTVETGSTINVSVSSPALAGPVSITESTWSCPITGMTAGNNIITINSTDPHLNTASLTSTIYVDNSGPTGSVSINNDAELASSQNVALYLSISDDTTSGIQVRIRDEGGVWSSWRNYSTRQYWNLPAGDGLKTVQVQFQDSSGNTSPGYQDSINLDTTKPVITIDTVSSPTAASSQLITGTREEDAPVTITSTGGIAEVSYPDLSSWQCTINLESGVNYITALATDTAGNRGSDSAIILLDDSTYVTVNPFTSPSKDQEISLNGSRESDATITVKALSASVSAVQYPSATSWSISLSDLSTGNNSVTVTATDNFSNTAQEAVIVVVDTTPPSGSIVINGNAPITNSTTVNLSLSATDIGSNVALMRFRNSGSYWGPWYPYSTSTSWILTAAEGSQTVEAQFQDLAGNLSPIVIDSIELDRTAPSITIAPVTSPTNEQSQTIRGYLEAGASISIIAPGVTIGPIQYPTSTSWQSNLILKQGTNNITVLSTDGALNTGSAAVSIFVDLIGTVTIAPVNSPTNQTGQLITGSREAGASITVDASVATAGLISYPTFTTWSSFISNLQSDVNIITVNTVDTLGNQGNASTSIIVDQTPPSVSINPLPAVVTGSTLNISGTIEADVTLSITTGSSSSNSFINDTTWNSSTILTEGLNVITATARDVAGNENSASRLVTLDSIAEVSINALPYTTNAIQTLSGTIESGGILTVSVDTAASIGAISINGTTWTCPITLIEGPNVITVNAEDTNQNSAEKSTVITLDTVVPTISIDTTPAIVTQASVSITGSKSADGLVSLSSSTATITTVSYPTNTTWQANLILTEGSNSIQTTVTDPTGNTSSASRQIGLDSLAEITFNPLPTPTNNVTHTLSGTLESGASLTASASPTSVSPLTTNGTFWSGQVSLAEGENDISITASDIHGNQNSITRRVVLDTESPQVTIDPVPSQLSVASIILSGTRDSDGLVSIQIDNAQYGTSYTNAIHLNSYTWEKQVSLQQGENTITVTAVDAAGNTGSAVVIISVDSLTSITMAPIASPTNNPNHTLTGSREANATVQVAMTGGSSGAVLYGNPTSWSCPVTLADNANLITVTATDTNNNKKSISATIVLDTTPPMPVDITATNTLQGGTVALNWAGYPSVDENISTFLVYAANSDFTDTSNMIPIRELSPGMFGYTVKGMLNGETWYFAVVGVDGAGNRDALVTAVSAVPTVQGFDGYVTDKLTGLPLRGARVSISGNSAVSTNNHGYYYLTGLPTGSYDLDISGTGYIGASASGILITPASMTRTDFTLKPQIILPSVPQNISADAEDRQVTVSWTDIPDIDLAGYQVLRYLSPGDTNPVIINPDLILTTFFVDMDLINGQTYHYTVKSIDQAGYASDESAMAEATPVAGPPLPASDISAHLNTDNTATLSWIGSPTAGTTFYNIYRGNSANSIDYTTVIGSVPANTTTWASPPLTPGASYYFGIRSEKNGLEETNTTLVASVTVPVIVYLGPKMTIIAPAAGKTVTGNLLTVEAALVQGDFVDVKHVTFQYRKKGNTQWQHIQAATAYSLNPDVDRPYFVHWNVVDDVPVGQYELRAVATAQDNSIDSGADSIIITIDPDRAGVKEGSDHKSRHRFQQIVRRNIRNLLKFYSNEIRGAYSVTIPDGSLTSDTELVAEIPKDEELADKLHGYSSIGRYLRLSLGSGQKNFGNGKEVEITIPYTDKNDDNIVDGTAININQLKIYWYNPQTKKWETSGIFGLTVDASSKTITAKTNHFSDFALIGSGANASDSDGDGVPDNEDAFPNNPNESIDSDGDGVGDGSDGCPGDPAKTAPGINGCGASDGITLSPGLDITVSPIPGVTLIIDELYVSCDVSIIQNAIPLSTPNNHTLIGGIYDINLDCPGISAKVCLDYDEASLSSIERDIRVIGQFDMDWQDITHSLDKEMNKVCGSLNSSAFFAAAEQIGGGGENPVDTHVNDTDTAVTTSVNGITDVTVNLDNGVIAGGCTMSAFDMLTPAAPADYRFVGGNAVDVDLSCSAGQTTICLQYDETDVLGQESSLRIYHRDSIQGWQDITNPGSLNVEANTICGTTVSFSPFVVVEPLTGDVIKIIPYISALPSADNDLLVNFNGSRSSCYKEILDPDSKMYVQVDLSCTYTWDFGGSGTRVGGNDNDIVDYQYDTPGNYTASLVITDQESGLSTSKSVTASAIVVEPPASPADFTSSVSGKTVTLNQFLPSEIVRVYVYWGDGKKTVFTDPQNDVMEHTFGQLNRSYNIRVMTIDADHNANTYTHSEINALTITTE